LPRLCARSTGGLQARVEQSREQAERLGDLAEQSEAQAAGEEKLLRDMVCVLGLSAQTSLDEIDGRLRGQRPRDVAVAVLRDQHQVREPIHYRAWFDLVKQQGSPWPARIRLRPSWRRLAAPTRSNPSAGAPACIACARRSVDSVTGDGRSANSS
jgi:hypothetical protein